MISRSGRDGPGFEPRLGPTFLFCWQQYISILIIICGIVKFKHDAIFHNQSSNRIEISYVRTGNYVEFLKSQILVLLF